MVRCDHSYVGTRHPLKIILQTLTHRLFILFTIGPGLVVLMLYVLSRLDPAGMPHFSVSRLLAFYVVELIWNFATMYMLVSRKWPVHKWATRSLYTGAVHAVLFSIACAGAGRYWPAGSGIYFTAAIAYIAYLTQAHMAIFIGIFASGFFLTQWIETPEVLERDLLYNLAMMVMSAVTLFWIGLAARSYRDQDDTIRGLLRDSRRDKRTIAQEREKSDGLLLSILPPAVAEELKETGKNRPVHYESASVLFTDFKGFTRIAESMGPEELVSELDRCFSYFDSLMDRYGLEKLKTIGDSYMCVGGIPEPNGTHAVDCVLAALEIQAFMNQMKHIKQEQGLEYWELRLGIHSGPLVAGVIGEKKFAYDVWSDTVNTASRCESSGEPGRINISGETRELVKDFFTCEYRGKVPAKHKGQVDMYFVQGILPELSRNGEGRVPGDEFKARYARLADGR